MRLQLLPPALFRLALTAARRTRSLFVSPRAVASTQSALRPFFHSTHAPVATDLPPRLSFAVVIPSILFFLTLPTSIGVSKPRTRAPRLRCSGGEARLHRGGQCAACDLQNLHVVSHRKPALELVKQRRVVEARQRIRAGKGGQYRAKEGKSRRNVGLGDGSVEHVWQEACRCAEGFGAPQE